MGAFEHVTTSPTYANKLNQRQLLSQRQIEMRVTTKYFLQVFSLILLTLSVNARSLLNNPLNLVQRSRLLWHLITFLLHSTPIRAVRWSSKLILGKTGT